MTIRNYAGHRPNIAYDAYIDPLALVAGQVTIEKEASIWPMSVLRGDVNHIEIGARTNVQDGSVLHVTHDSHHCPGGRPLILEHDITVGHNVNLHACVIQHHCLIGIGSIILDGAVIEPYTLLAAGSLVSPGKTLEGGYLWRGSPAQKARPLSPQEMDYFDYSALHYVKLAREHALLLEEP